MTEASGLGLRGFCHGIVVGDIDNDGDPDVFLCNYGPNVLYLNNGDGTFRDISKSAGIDRPDWSSGGAFLDYDNDGDLDLYVANYGDWKLPEDDIVLRRLEPKKVRRLLLAPTDPHRPSICSTATTATAPSPTSTTRHPHHRPRDRAARPGPTATGSAWSRPTSTATAGSTSTSPTT